VSLREEGAADTRGVVDWVCLRVDLDGQCVEDEPVDKVVQGSNRVSSARDLESLNHYHERVGAGDDPASVLASLATA